MVLGAIFFSIAALVTYNIQTENDQVVSTVRSVTSENRLNFIGQAIQADYFNNFLQSEFEESVVAFMLGGPYRIDPERTFEENLGSELERWLSDAASSIIAGAAGDAYSTAYSELPALACEPQELKGATADVNLREEDGVLLLSSWSLGQRIFCRDEEASSSAEIDLQARDYQLHTRVIQMFNKSVEAVRAAKAGLDRLVSVAQISSGWRLASDEDVKTDVLRNWLGDIGAMAITLAGAMPEEDGILLEPGSLVVSKDSKGARHSEEDLEVACHGKLTGVGGGGTQTCRPDGLSLVVGEEPPEDADGIVELEFESKATPEPQITITKMGDTHSLGLPEVIGKLLLPILSTVFNDPLSKGYVEYSGTTHLCRAFKGKASTAVVSGTVLETDADFLPSGMEKAEFRFYSTPQGIDDSSVTGTENDVDCDDEEHGQVLEENVLALLTANGNEELRVRVEKEKVEQERQCGETGEEGKCVPEGEAGEDDKLSDETGNCDKLSGETGTKHVCVRLKLTINETDLREVAERIAEHELYNVPGDTRSVSLSASVEGGDAMTVESDPVTDESEARGGLETLNDAIKDKDVDSETVQRVWGGGDDEDQGEDSYEENAEEASEALDKSSSSLTKSGQGDDGETLGLTTASICKMVGLKNWMEQGDFEKAMLAMCNMLRMRGEDAEWTCNLAGMYSAMESGSLQGLSAALNGMLRNAGHGFGVTPSMLQQAMQTGDLEDVLMAIASQAMTSGDAGSANFLAGAAQVLYSMESGDMDSMMASMAGMMDGDMAEYASALSSMNTALESGDADDMLNAVSQLAGSLGYGGTGEFGRVVSQLKNAADVIVSMDDSMLACTDQVESWDWLCIGPDIGKMVCGSYGSCQFDYALPPILEPELLCNEMVYDMGFRIDCTCSYKCPDGYTVQDTVSWGIDLNQVEAVLSQNQYAGLFTDAADLLAGGDLSGYMQSCRLDP